MSKNKPSLTIESIMKKLEGRVRYTVEHSPEDDSPEEHFASGDADFDKENVDWINSELANGNTWAWCHVTVKAHWRGMVGKDTLGGCSYKSEDDFCSPGGYFDDLKDEALRDLAEQLLEAHITLQELG